MSEHNALGYWSGLALCLTKVRSSRACCPATALIIHCNQHDHQCRSTCSKIVISMLSVVLIHKRLL